MKLMVKSAKELLQVLDETRETIFKDRKTAYPYTEWEHKRVQVKARLHRLPEYIRQAVFGVDVSYKYIERLYSDPEVKLALHNLFVLLLKDEGTSGDLAGDGTG